MSATSSDSEDAKTRQQCRKLRSSSREAELSSQGGHQQQSPSSPAPACLVGGDDLLPFLDAEQDNLFLFPEEWHGDASTLGMELRARQNKKQVFGRCDLKVDNVDEVLRQAHADLARHHSLRYTLVKRNPDGKSARVATAADVKDLSSLLSTKARVENPEANSNASNNKKRVGDEEAAHPAARSPAAGSSSPSRRGAASQYKPGGPCDHCGVCESPQWRRGPPEKPQLCNACGTRFRRTNNLGSPSGNASSSCREAATTSAAAAAGRKRGEIIRRHKADKKPRFDRSLHAVPVSA